MNDHVENGILVGVDFSTPSSPTTYEMEFDDGMKVQTTREHIELQEAPDVFTTKSRTIL